MPERRNPPAPAPPEPARDLKSVSAGLRDLVASLRTDRDRHAHAPHPSDFVHPAAPEPPAAARTHPLPAERGEGRGEGSGARAPAPAPAPGSSPGAAEVADLDRRRLAAELALAREGVAHAAAEREMTKRIEDLEAENRRLTDQYVAAQERATDVAQRYVALERLHGGLTRGETLAAMQEIVINVVGSEELAILELRGDRLALLQSFGIDPEAWRDVPVTAGALAQAASGTTWIAGRDPDGPADGTLSACIPLRAGDRVVGVLAVFRLLGHKPGFGEADHAVFDLLSTHGGLALHLRAASPRA